MQPKEEAFFQIYPQLLKLLQLQAENAGDLLSYLTYHTNKSNSNVSQRGVEGI